MGYDLTSESGDWCYFNVSMWYWVLALAFAFGWRPAGTAAPTINEGLEECDPDPNWDGTIQRRRITSLTFGDELTYTVASPAAGTLPVMVAWKYVK